MIYYILYVYLLSRLWIYYKWNFVMGIVFEPKCWSVSYGCEKWLSRLLPVKQIRFPIWLQMVFVLLSMYFQSRLILAQYGSVRWPLPQAQVLEIFSRTQRLVFLREFRWAGRFNVSAFTCPLQANINSIGSLARQIQRGSKSQEILGQTVKNFAAVESTVISTENNIAKLQVLSCFLHFFIKTLLSRC